MVLQTTKQVFLRYKWVVLALVLLVAANMVLQFLPALLLRNMIDTYFLQGVWQEGLWMVLLYAVITALGSVDTFLLGYTATYLGSKVLLALRKEMSVRLAKLPMAYYQSHAAGEVMSYFTSDVDTIQRLFEAGVVQALVSMFTIIGLGASVFVISPLVFAVLCVIFPFLFIMTNVYRKPILRLQTTFRRATADMNAYLQETIAGRFIIRLYGQQNRMVQGIQPILSRQFATTARLAALQMSFPVIRQTLWAVTVAIVAWVAGPTGLFFSLGLTLGSLAALADLVMRIFWPVEALSSQIHTLQEAMAGLRRIAEFEKEPLEEKHYDTARTPDSAVLTIDGLTYGYVKDIPVLQDINLTIDAGTKVALAGRTGSGKTTLMNLLAGLYTPWQGSIRIGGADPFHMTPTERRRWLGVVPQQACIFAASVLENITLRDPAISQQHVEAIMQDMGLHEEVCKLS